LYGVSILKVGLGAACKNSIKSDNPTDIDILVCIEFPSLVSIDAGAEKVK